MQTHRTLEGVILDLDGVITFTARVHAAAWKELFDTFLRKQSEQSGENLQPFDINFDYSQYVDGKPRLDGILSFLSARKIQIPLGSPSDSPDATTVWGLATQKNELFRRKLQQLDRKSVV